tara:strand:- start:9919 stop:10119 length:201 start_codon:yes stop_codon:yes gene_type:complete
MTEQAMAERRAWADFREWAETLDYGSRDKVMIIDSSIDNVGDVPDIIKIQCAKDTVLAFLDGAYDD